MTDQDRSLEASENLLQTYFCLGSALDDTTVLDEVGFKACLGSFEHPICNFAARLDLTPKAVHRLAELAATRKSFNVYSLPSDNPPQVRELLLRGGFQAAFRLEQMIAEPAGPTETADLELCTSAPNRLPVTTFMTEQFFGRQSEEFRTTIARAIAEAEGLPVYCMRKGGRILGALMLRESTGVTGLYNLCVDADQRGRGIGKMLAKWTLDHAERQGKYVTLQCDVRLQSWYASQGFRPCGAVDVLRCPNPIVAI